MDNKEKSEVVATVFLVVFKEVLRRINYNDY